MPKKYPPLTLAEVLEIIREMGFQLDNTVGSHAQYVNVVKGMRRRVTVDLTLDDDFDTYLIKSMISQSGLTREEFYCASKSAAKKINKRKK